ncbi:MAG: MFS transporter [Candidatus Jorgensenbacteria bacterium]
MRIKVDIKLPQIRVNRVIRSFIVVDLLLWGGWGLVSPVFALFVVDRIAGATAATVGVAVAVYWVVRSIVQVPTAVLLDRREGEKDDFLVLLAGLILAGFSAMAFPLVTSVAWLLSVALLQGIAFGLYIPAWSAIFSRHLDKEHYAFDWSLDNTTLGIAAGVAAAIGGAGVSLFGFNAIFIFAGVLSFASALVLFLVPNLMFPHEKRGVAGEPFIRDHTPAGTPH